MGDSLGERISDFIMCKIIPIILVSFFFLLLLAMPFYFYGVWNSMEHDEKMHKECIADGHKEYECEVMLRRPQPASYPVVYPLFIHGK